MERLARRLGQTLLPKYSAPSPPVVAWLGPGQLGRWRLLYGTHGRPACSWRVASSLLQCLCLPPPRRKAQRRGDSPGLEPRPASAAKQHHLLLDVSTDDDAVIRPCSLADERSCALWQLSTAGPHPKDRDQLFPAAGKRKQRKQARLDHQVPAAQLEAEAASA